MASIKSWLVRLWAKIKIGAVATLVFESRGRVEMESNFRAKIYIVLAHITYTSGSGNEPKRQAPGIEPESWYMWTSRAELSPVQVSFLDQFQPGTNAMVLLIMAQNILPSPSSHPLTHNGRGKPYFHTLVTPILSIWQYFPNTTLLYGEFGSFPPNLVKS